MAEHESDPEYYILDRRVIVGNTCVWWGKDSKGYVCDLALAGLYHLDDRAWRSTDIPIHRSLVDSIKSEYVDEQRLWLPLPYRDGKWDKKIPAVGLDALRHELDYSYKEPTP